MTKLNSHIEQGKNKIGFKGGRNIAMKVPPHLWEATVEFYRDIIGLKIIDYAPTVPPSVCFEFGANQLWVDRVEHMSQAEIWLDLVVDDIEAASDYLKSVEVVRCDEIEPLPASFKGFWITNPSSIIHNVKDTSEE